MQNDCFNFNPFTGKRLIHPIPVRVLETKISYSELKCFKPLILDKADGDPLEEISDCINNRWLFNYETGFKGEKMRWLIGLDELIEG